MCFADTVVGRWQTHKKTFVKYMRELEEKEGHA